MLNRILKSTAKDVAIYFPGQLLMAVAALVTIPVYSRLLSTSEYGALGIILALGSAGTIGIGNWLTSSVMRFLAYYKQRQESDSFYSSLATAYLLSLIVLLSVGAPAYYFCKDRINPEIARMLPLAGLVIAMTSLLQILQTILRADQRARSSVGFGLTNSYGTAVVGITLVAAAGLGAQGVLLGGVIAGGIACTGICLYLWRKGARVRTSAVSPGMIREFAAYGIPACVATIGTWMLALFDRFIIGHYRGTSEVGLYDMGFNLADKSINMVVASMMMAIGPIVIHTWESSNREHTASLLGQLTRLLLILIVPMVAGLALLSGWIYHVFIGADYHPGASVLGWSGLRAAIYGLSLMAYTGLILGKKTTVMACNYLLAAAVNIVLNVIFIPRFGYMAAAVAAPVSCAFLLALNVRSATVYLPWLFPWKSFARTLLGAGVMAAGVTAWQMALAPGAVTLLAAVMIGALIYGMVLLLAGEVSPAERGAARQMLADLRTRMLGATT